MEEIVRYAKLSCRRNDAYFVSSDGRVFRVRELSPFVNRGGYAEINTFASDGKLHPKTVHSLVAEAFIGERPPGMTINHKDGNKLNNSDSNLEYITLSENMKHAYRTGLHPVDLERLRQMARKQKARRKLTDEQVVALIKAYRSGGKTMKQVGKEFGVEAATVCYAVNGKTWKNLQALAAEQ